MLENRIQSMNTKSKRRNEKAIGNINTYDKIMVQNFKSKKCTNGEVGAP